MTHRGEFERARVAGLRKRNQLRLARAQKREQSMIDDLTHAAALALPATEAEQIAAVREVRTFLLEIQTADLSPEQLADPALLIDAEADKRAAAGDRTASVWTACAQSMRLKAATNDLEQQFTGEA